MKELRPENELSIRLSEVEKKSYEKLQEKGLIKRIDPNTFRGLAGYEDNVVDGDLQAVAKKKEYIARQDTKYPHQIELKKISDVFETILAEQIELNEGFGQDALIIQTSEYDDLINGIDAIIEFDLEEGVSHLALGVDITFGIISGTKLQQKFESIRGDLNLGKLAKVRYFESEHGIAKGELSELPKVVIGVDRETVNELAKAWLTQTIAKAELKKPDLGEASRTSLLEGLRNAKQKLEKHFVQILFLKQIKLQLETYIDFLDYNIVDFPNSAFNPSWQHIVERLNHSLDIINDIIKSKQGLSGDDEKQVARLLGDMRNRLDSIFNFQHSKEYRTGT